MGLGALGRRLTQSSMRLLNQSTMPVAIDFGAGALKLLQVTPGDPPTLVAAASLDTPDELLFDASKRLAFQIDALPKLVRSCGFKTKRAVCAIPAGQTLCKHLQVPAGDAPTVASMVRTALASQIGCDPSALVLRHKEVPSAARAAGAHGGPKSEVICMAASRELVERLMQAIKASRLDPVGMHSEFQATIQAFDYITRRVTDANLTGLYLDIGAGSTKVMIAHGTELVFARTIDLAGRHLDEAISRQIKREHAEARRRRLTNTSLTKSRPAPAPAPEPASGMALLPPPAGGVAVMTDRRQSLAGAPEPDFDLSEQLEILTDEVSLCLRYHESLFPDRRVDRAIFVGGEARHVGLCQHVARTLRLPAQVADPMARVARTGREPTPGADLRTAQPGWAMLLGLCLSPTDL